MKEWRDFSDDSRRAARRASRNLAAELNFRRLTFGTCWGEAGQPPLLLGGGYTLIGGDQQQQLEEGFSRAGRITSHQRACTAPAQGQDVDLISQPIGLTQAPVRLVGASARNSEFIRLGSVVAHVLAGLDAAPGPVSTLIPITDCDGR